MVKRTASAVLWFLAVAWGFNYVSALTGVPAIFGMILGLAVCAFVCIDPLHLIWPVRTVSPATSMPDAPPVSGAVQTRA